MILEKTPLSLIEVKEYIKDVEEAKTTIDYIKKFSKINEEKATKLKSDIQDLKNPKIKEENIIKIIDFLPKSQEEVNKIFTEATLTEEEANAIIEITGKY